MTLAEKNERLQSQLRSLKDELADTRDDQVFNVSKCVTSDGWGFEFKVLRRLHNGNYFEMITYDICSKRQPWIRSTGRM